MIAFSQQIADVPYVVRNGLRRNAVAAFVLVMLQLGDVISTHVGLHAGLQEVNPLASRLFSTAGVGSTYGLKLALITVFLLLICLLEPRFPRIWRAVRITNVIMLLVVLLNSVQLFW